MGRVSKYVYTTFYILLHTSFSIYTSVLSVVLKVIKHCHEFIPNKDVRYYNNLKSVRKMPAHLTILLGREEPSYKDLANIVIWCMSIRIHYLSFYDYKGILKKNQAELQYEVNNIKQKEDHIIWHQDPSTQYKNGYLGRKIHIKILSQEDGKSGVVSLCKNIVSNNIETDFSIGSIDKHLFKQFEFPDPELGLYCGSTFSLYNYPQWQIRVTEFLEIKSHHNITFKLFAEKILRYTKCEQRLGK